MAAVTIFYAGPSLFGRFPEPLEGEVWRGPAKQGDILRDAMELKPRMIVLIDGCFNQSLSVWHKELVYALLEGVICAGAASMGALRAAELDRYGMIGVGKIYRRYAEGEEDDALVMLSFDPETYRPLSEPAIGGELKTQDALEAVEFARTYRGQPSTTLKRDAISPYLQVVIDRILEQ